jgi:hypothetical protein
MGVAVVVLLGGLWASILVPAAVRARRETSPLHSVDHFERSMGMLAPKPSVGPANTPGRYVMVLERPSRLTGAARMSPAIERRKAVLLRLLGAVPITGILAWTSGGFFALLFRLSILALVAYVLLLVQVQSRRMQAARKLHHLPVRRQAEEPAAIRVDRRPRAVGGGRF